ncbi:hypothetical protein KCMC57_up15300 [Kitasatospora sp. CMC57]|uniref:Uncharacterized protein n=1 Tax=Kitasatospora sp. CMC57 TaxID=3231513 RepID=A0AB33JPK8_9ACTN
MALLEMGGAAVQGCLVDWPEGFAPRDEPVVGFDVLFAGGVAEREGVLGDVDGEGEGVADGVGDGDVTGAGDWGGDGRGIPIAGASACMPTRLLAMTIARIAPTTETGQPRPRSSRPRRPDWETNTGAGAGSSGLDSYTSTSGGHAGPRSTEVVTGRTVRRLSVQGT